MSRASVRVRDFWEYRYFASRDILEINLILLVSMASLRRGLLASRDILEIRSILLVNRIS
jgi:hypothetical protein